MDDTPLTNRPSDSNIDRPSIDQLLKALTLQSEPENPMFGQEPARQLRRQTGNVGEMNYTLPHFHPRTPNHATSSALPISNLAPEIQSRLHALQQQVARLPGLASPASSSIVNSLRSIGQSVNQQYRELRLAVESKHRELENCRAAFDQYSRDGAVIRYERDLAIRKQRSTEERLHRKEHDIKKLEEQITHMELKVKNFKLSFENLQRTNRIQEEQLSGKRSLWVETHKPTTSRHNVENQVTPTHNPTFSRQVSLANDSGNALICEAGEKKGSSSTYKPAPSWPLTTAHLDMFNEHTHPLFQTGYILPAEPGTPPAGANRQVMPLQAMFPKPNHTQMMTQALVPVNERDYVAEEFADLITEVWKLINGWAMTYAHTPNIQGDTLVEFSNESVWTYMLNLTYASRSDATAHTRLLLADPLTRHCFTMRMAVQYIVKNIWVLEVFQGFSPQIDGNISFIKEKMRERGLANVERQTMIDLQADSVRTIAASERYEEFRRVQLAFHTKCLRDILGPVLDVDCSRADAGRDISVFVKQAWAVAAKMFSSSLSFQIYMPDTAAKFSASTMVCKDVGHKSNGGPTPFLGLRTKDHDEAIQLQIRQARLKLVITPVITMRDDRGVSIRCKSLHVAHVLVMQ